LLPRCDQTSAQEIKVPLHNHIKITGPIFFSASSNGAAAYADNFVIFFPGHYGGSIVWRLEGGHWVDTGQTMPPLNVVRHDLVPYTVLYYTYDFQFIETNPTCPQLQLIALIS